MHGTNGLVMWGFRTAGELRLSTGEDYANHPTCRVLVGPDVGEYARFQPGSGIPLSYNDTNVIELASLSDRSAPGSRRARSCPMPLLPPRLSMRWSAPRLA
jgi:hypothetical protein